MSTAIGTVQVLGPIALRWSWVGMPETLPGARVLRPLKSLLRVQGDRGSELSVEDLLRIVRTLPADASAVTAVREG